MIEAKIRSVFVRPTDDDPREYYDLTIEGKKIHWAEGLELRIPFIFSAQDRRIQFLEAGVTHDLMVRSITDSFSRGYLDISWSDDRPAWESSEVKFEVFLARPEDLHAMYRLHVAFRDLVFVLPDNHPAFKRRR